jgi:two-component system cell cycle sensor histidine kinase/response regulator CckA
MVQQSGGQIRVYSEPGRGTTFRLYFPVDETPEVATTPSAVPHAGARDAVILLVEDDDRVRAAIRRTLDQAGFTVLEARDGLEAQTIADEHGGTIDLMLTDMVMPGASGPDAAAALRWKRPDLKVLFMSGYTDRAVIHNGMLDGAAQFIEKPFTPDAILAKIRSLL